MLYQISDNDNALGYDIDTLLRLAQNLTRYSKDNFFYGSCNSRWISLNLYREGHTDFYGNQFQDIVRICAYECLISHFSVKKSNLVDALGRILYIVDKNLNGIGIQKYLESSMDDSERFVNNEKDRKKYRMNEILKEYRTSELLEYFMASFNGTVYFKYVPFASKTLPRYCKVEEYGKERFEYVSNDLRQCLLAVFHDMYINRFGFDAIVEGLDRQRTYPEDLNHARYYIGNKLSVRINVL